MPGLLKSATASAEFRTCRVCGSTRVFRSYCPKGSPPRCSKCLRKQGHQVGHERVRRSLLRQGLRPLYRRRYRLTTDSNHRKPIADNVLDRRFDGWAPNRAWVGDITYIATDEGWLYLAVVM